MFCQRFTSVDRILQLLSILKINVTSDILFVSFANMSLIKV